jgi:hypothetical protein
VCLFVIFSFGGTSFCSKQTLGFGISNGDDDDDDDDDDEETGWVQL